MGTSRAPLVVGFLGVLSSGAARAAPPDAAEQAALDAIADRSARSLTVVKRAAWSADTVKHLQAWLGGDDRAATAHELALLDEELARPVALSVTGAVSLGNYQGGFLYYLSAALADLRALEARAAARGATGWRRPETSSPLSLVTGASSGSINAFIAAMAACQELEPAPRKSLFWNVWVPVGRDQLVARHGVSPDGLLSIDPIETSATAVKTAWEKGRWRPGPCRVDIGLSATRLAHRYVQPLDDVNLALPVQNERFVTTLEVGEVGAPRLAPFEPSPNDSRTPLVRKLLRRPASYAIGDVIETLRASSAFSFAFPPRWLHLASADADARDDAWFTDGGVFDDRPVGLAVEMRRWRLAADGLDPDKHPTRFLVQDPDVTAASGNAAKAKAPTSLTSPAADAPGRRSFVDTWLPFASDFMDTAFSIELLSALEREEGLLGQLEIPPRRGPVAGAYLLEFLAFVEEDFRVYDFYTGMVDAWQHLAESSLAFQVLRASGGGPSFVDAPELDCLLAYRTQELAGQADDVPAACGVLGSGAANLEALARASHATKRWRDGQAPSTKSTIDGEEARFLSALGEGKAPYVYRDLKYRGAPANADTVSLAIRDDLQVIVDRTTTNQAWSFGRFLVGGLGKAALNFAYVYRPLDWQAGVNVVSDRGLELTLARRLPIDELPRPLDFRLELALRVAGVHVSGDFAHAPGDRDLVFSPGAAAHLMNELQLQRWWPNFQSSMQIAVGGGWAVESMRTFDGPIIWRHGPEAVLGLAFFQRLTLDFIGSWYLDDCKNDNTCGHVAAAWKGATHPIVDGDWGLRFSIGFRYYVF